MSEKTSINTVYHLDADELRDAALYNYYYEKMTLMRRQKIDRYFFEKDKRLSLGAGILLFFGLRAVHMETERIEQDVNGKPYLPERPEVQFNLSHSGNMVVCAFSDRPVGIDIEKNTCFEDELIHSVFQESEISYIKLHSSEPDADFTRLWTMKESVLKHSGAGLETDPLQIAVDLENNVLCGDRKLYFTHYSLEGYPITVCSEYQDFTDELMPVTLCRSPE